MRLYQVLSVDFSSRAAHGFTTLAAVAGAAGASVWLDRFMSVLGRCYNPYNVRKAIVKTTHINHII